MSSVVASGIASASGGVSVLGGQSLTAAQASAVASAMNSNPLLSPGAVLPRWRPRAPCHCRRAPVELTTRGHLCG